MPLPARLNQTQTESECCCHAKLQLGDASATAASTPVGELAESPFL
jgi:hypothetical protein